MIWTSAGSPRSRNNPFATLALASGLLAICGTAHAQAPESVLCHANIRKLDAELQATERRVDALNNAAKAERCSAMRVHLNVLFRAKDLYGRCLREEQREQRLPPLSGSTAYFRTYVGENCSEL
jgi:hypothetical protein